jgi:putative tryptophan/tyrosine transport system substrate-binding protein
MMRRRDFITLLGGAATAWPIAASAQQAMPVIGLLSAASAEVSAPFLTAFRQGLKELGFEEGRNVTIEYRFAEGDNDRLPAMAAELVRRQVALMIAPDIANTALAAKAATATIPIVFTNGSDPVKLGLVASLNHPGGNITGVSNYQGALGPKRLELLRELVPQVAIIGLLRNPTNLISEGDRTDLQDAARAGGQQLIVFNATNVEEIDAAFATASERRVGAFVVDVDGSLFARRREQIIALAVRYGIPASYSSRDYSAAGGLMSYGAIRSEINRVLGSYAGRILKGEKPRDLPVQQATKFELVINLKAARAIGLTIPEAFLLRADEVIE